MASGFDVDEAVLSEPCVGGGHYSAELRSGLRVRHFYFPFFLLPSAPNSNSNSNSQIQMAKPKRGINCTRVVRLQVFLYTWRLCGYAPSQAWWHGVTLSKYF